MHDIISRLIDEIKALRAENERLQTYKRQQVASITTLVKLGFEQEQEIKQLELALQQQRRARQVGRPRKVPTPLPWQA
jgi:Holliday junction resolvasome RuvABC DNA-binding subunit